MMLFMTTEGAPESAIMFGFISYMFVYALYLVRLLEQPFAKEHGSFDDVSLFLLNEFEDALRKPVQHQEEGLNYSAGAAQNFDAPAAAARRPAPGAKGQ